MLSGIVTSIMLVLFVVGWAWAWNPRRKAAFDEAAQLPFNDVPLDDAPGEDKP
ncbi:MAG: cbb3-type cytochrome oxidase subunit 3 [Thermomonas sp.]